MSNLAVPEAIPEHLHTFLALTAGLTDEQMARVWAALDEEAARQDAARAAEGCSR